MSKDKFTIGIHGLSKDMEDFIFEEAEFYSDRNVVFWTSFWDNCIGMFAEGIDLSDKQLDIINREYKKVAKGRGAP